MLGNGGVLVDLQLDRTEALDIALRLQDAGVSLALQPEEAILSADGHLMEYIALLTTGERMRAVLAAQAESLLVLPDDTAANVARAVCSGHALGLSIDAVELPKLAQVAGPLLTNALRRLQDEHIVVSDEGTQWRGLHQRRSDMLVEFLHKTPPPAIGGTLTAVLCAVQPDAVGWALRRTVEVFGDVAWDLTKVARHAATRCQNANELAILLEGLERADYALTAFRYIPALQRHRPQGLSLLNLAHLVCAYKFNGFSLGGGGGSFSGLDQRVRTIANELPDSIAIYREAASEALSESLIVDFICKADLEEAVRLLEVPSLMRASILPFPPILVFGFGRFRPCRYRSRPSSVLRPSRASMLSPKHLLHALQTAL